jgi:hypothetical protein
VAERKFDLGEYVEVKDRLKILYELYPQARLVTAEVRWPQPDDDKPRVAVKALAYRTPDDPYPAVGWSWMELPGTTPYTRGSELENTETSAWGRAIAALGILVDRSIASAQEVANKEGPAEERGDGSLIGIVEAGDKSTSDYQVRTDPDGLSHLGFRLRGDRGGILVEAVGELADALYAFREELLGARVTCWGSIAERSFTTRGERPKTVTYQVLALERLTGPGGIDLPARRDAESLPLFEATEAELDAALP